MNVRARLANLLRSFRKRSFALNDLDLKLRRHVRRRGGFFVEAGANNGLDQTNTLFFEKYHGWHGLLIEPIPELASACRANRPQCIVENCALVPFGFPAESIEMRYGNLMSLVKGAQKSEERDNAHIELGCAIQGITSYELRVPAKTLTAVLDLHRIAHFDLLSLDVEGFELDALKGLDFERFCPTHLLIEARFREEIDTFLMPRYRPIAELSQNDVLYELVR